MSDPIRRRRRRPDKVHDCDGRMRNPHRAAGTNETVLGGYWEFPGGKIEPKANSRATAWRASFSKSSASKSPSVTSCAGARRARVRPRPRSRFAPTCVRARGRRSRATSKWQSTDGCRLTDAGRLHLPACECMRCCLPQCSSTLGSSARVVVAQRVGQHARRNPYHALPHASSSVHAAHDDPSHHASSPARIGDPP